MTGLPTVSLDHIRDEYLTGALTAAGIDIKTLSAATYEVLQRPLYFNAWRTGLIAIDETTTIHSVYEQLIDGIERRIEEEAGQTVSLGEIFGGIAFRMIDTGELSAPLAQIHAELRAVLDGGADIGGLVEHLMSAGVLLATPLRRVAFFHHTVAEYFAARYLAALVAVDRAAIQRCLRNTDWDQALFLTLGFLPADEVRLVFDEVLRTDIAMALRSLNYVEHERGAWTNMALEYLAHDWAGSADEHLVLRALQTLRVDAGQCEALVQVMGRGGSIGGSAAGLLWTANESLRPWLLDHFLDATNGYNFLARFAEVIARMVPPDDALLLLGKLEEIPIAPDVAELLRAGEPTDEFVGIIHATAELVALVPGRDLIELARASTSDLVRVIVADGLTNSKVPESFTYLQEMIIAGRAHAISDLYFLLRHGTRSWSPPMPDPELIRTLAQAITMGDQSYWAMVDLRILSDEFPEIGRIIRREGRSHSPLGKALLAYAAGGDSVFLEDIRRISSQEALFQGDEIKALRGVKIGWAGYEDTLIELLRYRKLLLTRSLLDAKIPSRDDPAWVLNIRLADVEWWVDSLRLFESMDWHVVDRLGRFLAVATDDTTRQRMILLFNTAPTYRQPLHDYVFPRLDELSLDSFDTGALEWLLGQLSIPRPPWELPLIATIATESFIQDRMLPLLLDNPPSPLRENLTRALHNLGRLHRRRYIREDGEPMA
ncbi:hypothetical protein GCM10009555_029280 [Acrocarpospora macrocephala]|uniref:Uncharacterized protein n=1 Tax=Acrocarpospora macrocephala TaxID=150177 RepID=A0A5M3WQJ5_9ACTN|nr:hypothetical protein Amac_047610 [Acrocarpospora macrocephala]